MSSGSLGGGSMSNSGDQRLDEQRLVGRRLDDQQFGEQRLGEQRLVGRRLDEQQFGEQRLGEQRLVGRRLDEQQFGEQRLRRRVCGEGYASPERLN
jgi:hypothetical protein